MKLSDVAIRALKPDHRDRKLSDGRGLFLLVRPTGARLWRMAYRHSGKQKLLSLGAYPDVGLRDARSLAMSARELLRSGADPSEKRREEKRARQDVGNTFRVIAAELLAKKVAEKKAPVTLAKNKWLLDTASETLGDDPIRTITASDVLGVLRKVEQKGHHETASRMRAVIGQVFRYAIATDRADNDPTFALRGALIAPKVTHRAAITNAKQFGELLCAVDGFRGQDETRAALQLMALLFQRPGELRQAEWSEFDLERCIWTIPATRMKMRREHRVPLPHQAVAILERLHALNGRGKLAFPGTRVVTRPLSDNTLNAALRRLGYSQTEMTAHGFRASASTLLNESGLWSADAIERALAHQEEGKVRRAYARGEHWEERVRMAQWWADHLDDLRTSAERRGGRTRSTHIQ